MSSGNSNPTRSESAKVSRKIIDLTRPLSNSMKGVDIEKAKILSEDGWNATTLHLYSHVGTHMDAPYHFQVSDQRIDEIPVDRFISEAWVVDLSHLPASSLIEPSHLASLENQLSQGDSILLRTDWSKRFGTDAYRNEFPRISTELAHWLGIKNINILGVEAPSVADVKNMNEVAEIHTILFQHDIVIVEGLMNLDALSLDKVTLMAMPLKVEKGDGAPARVIAVEEIHRS